MDEMKIYVASKWQEREMVKDIIDILKYRNHKIMADLTDHPKHAHNRFYAIEAMAGIKECDLLIAYMANEHYYKGTWVEIGAALVLNIEVYIVGDVTGVFVDHPLVTKFGTIAQVINFLDSYELRKKLEWNVIRYEELKGVAIASDKNARKKSRTMGRKVLKMEMELRTMGWEAVIDRDKVSYRRIGNSKKQESLI